MSVPEPICNNFEDTNRRFILNFLHTKGHQQLFKIIDRFLKQHPQSELFAAVESTGGYENNWYNSLKRLQQTLAIYVARLNPLGVMHNSKADLKRNNTDKISASNVAEYLIAHSGKVNYQQHDRWASLRKQWRRQQRNENEQTGPKGSPTDSVHGGPDGHSLESPDP